MAKSDNAGARLREARKQRGLSVTQVAERAGFSDSTVRAHENGQNKLRPEPAEVYSRILRLDVAWLLYGQGAPLDELPEDALVDAPLVAARGKAADLVTVNEYDVRLSAGGGALFEAENVKGVWQFSRSYIEGELRLNPASLGVVEVQGDSMVPTLHSGDRVLVDHSDRNAALPGIYAIWDSNATVVKRLERVPASAPLMLVLISDNKNHNQYTVPADLVNVIGRVVWFARRI